jgi:integrase/recombinase XerD
MYTCFGTLEAKPIRLYDAGVPCFRKYVQEQNNMMQQTMIKEKEISMSKVELQSPHFKILFQEYDTLIRSKNLVTKGIGMYQSCVKEFFSWLEGQGKKKIKVFTTADMIDYYEYLSTRPNKRKAGTLSESMVNQHLFSLRMLFDYLLETKQIDSVVLVPKNNHGTSKERNIASVQEIEAMYQQCRTKKESALLSILYGCGLRRSEAYLLNTNDINFSTGILVVRNGKLYKRREIAMSNGTIKYLKDYLINERTNYLRESNRLESAFLINQRGARMRGDTYNDVLRDIITRTKKQTLIKKEITAHCLRHSIATHLLDNGADIEFVQQFLGHAQIDTSHIYSRKRKNRNLFNHQ